MVLIETKEDITVAFITTQVKWKEEFDIFLNPSSTNGLKKTSMIRLNKLATIDKEYVLGRLGTLDEALFQQLNKNLIQIF